MPGASAQGGHSNGYATIAVLRCRPRGPIVDRPFGEAGSHARTRLAATARAPAQCIQP